MIGRMGERDRREKRLRGVSGPGGLFLLGVLVWALAGCALVVSKKDYREDKKKVEAQLQFIRRQLSGHTQTLANHGKSINEVRLQIRDVLARVGKQSERAKGPAGAAKASVQAPERKRIATPAQASAKKPMKGFSTGAALYIRSSWRGLPLNYAGGYRSPRGRPYPYKLSPGTKVRALSEDRRGFTRVEAVTGRWKGKRMWVRTVWLVENRPPQKRSSARN